MIDPAEAVPLCPSFNITLVDATFSPNLKTVANNKTVGKLEKSSGLKVCKATISTNKETNKFDVNRISNIHGCNGMTIIAIRIIIPIGMLNALAKLRKFSFWNVFSTKSIYKIPLSEF